MKLFTTAAIIVTLAIAAEVIEDFRIVQELYCMDAFSDPA